MESVYHRGRSCSHYPVLFHVCMVYQPGEYMVDKTDLYALSVCHGGAVSDGNVHLVQDCKYAQTQYSMGADLHLSGVWCRAGGIYVYRIYEVHSTGDRRGGND